MKIFLNGGGCGRQTTLALQRFNDIIDHTKPLLYIPLAMERERYPDCYEWIQDELRETKVPFIEMVRSANEIAHKKMDAYCAVFIGGGNTFKLLYELKESGAFEKIKRFIEEGGIVFGGSAGAIIFGRSPESCAQADKNEAGLQDIWGYDVLNGVSILCHYTRTFQTNARHCPAGRRYAFYKR